MIPFCIPLLDTSPDRIRERISAAEGNYRYFEVWLDPLHATPLSARVELVADLTKQYGERMIFVTRRQGLAEPETPLEQRISLINEISSTKALLDFDIVQQKSELELVRAKLLAPKLLLSFHNYEFTPDAAVLREHIASMDALKPAIYKISTKCKSPEDAIRLLSLQLVLRKEGKRHIILGMGEHGAATRVFGSLWGNEFTFAPETAAEASAPGQLTREELTSILSILETP